MFELQVDDDITLRNFDTADADALFALVDANRTRLRQWMPWVDSHSSAIATLGFIYECELEYNNVRAMTGGVWYRGQLAGVIGHNRIDVPNRIGFIGYWLGAAFEGRGIMTKSCRALVDYAFDELGRNRIDIRCAVGNTKSRGVARRLGFREEGVIRDAEWLYDHYVDHVVYGMLARDWDRERIT